MFVTPSSNVFYPRHHGRSYCSHHEKALLLANENISDTTPVNAGVREHISINDVVEAIYECVAVTPAKSITDDPVGVKSRAADTSRVGEIISWEHSGHFLRGLLKLSTGTLNRKTESSSE
jgi:UDP-glucose 4-epimerase